MAKEDMLVTVQRLMHEIPHIRNIGIVAHIDHGKCVKGDARIHLVDGRSIPAEALFAEIAVDAVPFQQTETESVFAPQARVAVFSLNKESGAIEERRISHAWKLAGGELIKVTLQNGSSISTTPEHRFIVWEQGAFK